MIQTCPALPNRIRPTLSVLAMCLVLALSGCFRDDDPTGATTGQFWPADIDCQTVPDDPENLADADLGLTPRSSPLGERLALHASGELVAPEALYQRVVAEMIGIRQRFPLKSHATLRGCWASDQMILQADDESHEVIKSGQYEAWDELNALLDVKQITPYDLANLVFIRYEGHYHPQRIALEYAALPGIDSASPDSWIGGGADMCMAVRGDYHFYMFMQGSGDCMSGCINRSYFAVEADSSGNLLAIGSWSDDQDNPPLWYENAEDCRAFMWRS